MLLCVCLVVTYCVSLFGLLLFVPCCVFVRACVYVSVCCVCDVLCDVVWCARRCSVSVRAEVCYLMCLRVVFARGWLIFVFVFVCVRLCACVCVMDVCASSGNDCVALYVLLWVGLRVTRLFNACVLCL